MANGGAELNASASRRVLPSARAWLTGSVASLLVVTAWSLASPIGSGPDSAFHLSSVWCAGSAPATGCPIEEIIPGHPRARLPTALVFPSCYNRLPDGSPACAVGIRESGTSSARPNQVRNIYPDGFYNALGVLAGEPVQSRVVLMRMMSGAFSITVIGLSSLLLCQKERRRFLFLALAMHVPLGLFLAASINPSGVSLAVVIAAVPPGLRFQRSEHKKDLWPPAAWSTLLLLVATTLRPDTALFVALVLLSITADRLVQLIISGRRGPVIVGGLLVAFVATAYSSTDFADVIRSGIRGALRADVNTDITLSLIINNSVGVFLLWFAGIGGWAPSDVAGLGELDVGVPRLVPLLVLAVIIARAGHARRATPFTRFSAPSTLLALAWLIPFWTLTVSGLKVGEQVQPRYILHLVAGAITVVGLPATPPTHWIREVSRLELCGLSIAHSLALAALISHYSFNGINGASLSAIFSETPTWRWSSTSPALVWMAGTVAFTILSRSLQGRTTQQPTLGRRDGIR